MYSFPNWVVAPGLLWLLCVVPALFFIGGMFLICRFGRGGAFINCCQPKMPDLTVEVIELRKELEEIKKKLG